MTDDKTLKLQTIEDYYNTPVGERYTWLCTRQEWLQRQRRQEKKEVIRDDRKVYNFKIRKRIIRLLSVANIAIPEDRHITIAYAARGQGVEEKISAHDNYRRQNS